MTNSVKNQGAPAGSGKQPKPTRRLLQWHRWCGLLVLVFLVVASFSGSLLVYKQALIRILITPDAQLPADYAAVQMAPQLDAIAQQIAGENSGYLIKAPNADEPYWTLTRDTDHQVHLLALNSLQAYEQNLWLLDALSFMHSLHTELFAGMVGEALLLVSGLAGLFLAISGVILWWPAKRGFRWRWIFPHKWKLSYLLHYHRHSGALTAPLLILLLLTGSIMLWQKLVRPILPPVAVTHIPHAISNAADASPAQLFLQSQAKLPDGWPTYIRLPFGDNQTVSFRYRLPNEWHSNGRSSVKIDITNGDMFLSKRSDQVNWEQNLLNQTYPLHSGYGMNPVYRLLVLICGIAVLWLSITGGLSYWRRYKKAK